MLFHSLKFIWIFLPLALLGYFLLNRFSKTKLSIFWLLFVSLFFYGWWNWIYLPLIIGSIVFNYAMGMQLSRLHSKTLLGVAIAVNLIVLGYYKYVDFFIDSFNYISKEPTELLSPVLPLAISFFTFQQIAFLIDCYRDECREYSLWNYSLFVSFFPQLVAGPIVHHKKILPQFEEKKNQYFSVANFAKGLFIFSIGLFKKIVISDSLATLAKYGFDETHNPVLIVAWLATLAYTFQIYFDFSGYSDMAIGCALFFNIELCINFNSPYKASDIQDFWRRWHISLSNFLKDYLYIPLGGNQGSHINVCRNLFITFLLAGLWHGAGWTFIGWGCIHGVALLVHRTWKKCGFHMPKLPATLITFLFINITWVFFRANSWKSAIDMLKGLFGFNGFGLTFLEAFPYKDVRFVALSLAFIMVFFSAFLVFYFKNSQERLHSLKFNYKYALFTAFAFSGSMVMHELDLVDFLYFNF